MPPETTRRRRSTLAANPVLVGAVTTLVVVTAVFLSWGANQGLPFVPSYEFRVVAPTGARLVVGNDVREGGERIGVVRDVEVVRTPRGSRAEVTLAIDAGAGPLPEDSTVLVRPRSALGLKHVDVVRGRARATLPAGATIPVDAGAVPPELDEFFSIFDEPTREDVRTNLTTGGPGFAGRGVDLNRTLAALPQLLGDLVPVMRTLSDPETDLRGFVRELADAARVVRPVAEDLAGGFRSGAQVFEAVSRDPQALRETIAESPATLQAGIDSFGEQRPLLRQLASISDELQGTAREIRASAPTLGRALGAGTAVLPDTPAFNERLETTFSSLRELAGAPTTNLTLAGLGSTLETLNPTLRWVGPHITVCNSWNLWWTFLSDHLNEQVPTGTLQRIQVKLADPAQPNSPQLFGATLPANGGPLASPLGELTGQPAYYHEQHYGRAVDEEGNADCESGQRGYPNRLTNDALVPSSFQIATASRTPGDQGPTATGKPRVPEAQTFAAEPEGLSPPALP
ncbi:MlaD family protein [Conexibacter sp. SYSU D00693]|uniref:MlaD family protein n=1 Tax=Conexibacter sp. SYSU D00693 TaxID=2812560 RepID=UPI00196B4851|nr:MlaD family protein [Conexibacter sp. SYSU D00693]